MKKIFFFFSVCILANTKLLAQQVQIQETPPNWAFMLSNLNTTQITSGILYNKTAMFSSLYDYNRGNYNISHAEHFMQAINELYYASEQTKFISASQLKTNTANTESTTVNIGIINTSIHQLNFNEKDPTTGGLTFSNGQFVPISGQPSFLSRKFLLVSPLKETVSGANVTYNFSNSFIYNNASSAIKKLIVYFNDATPVTIIDNGSVILPTKTINYTTSESKTLKFVATFQDNSTITTFGYHYFKYVPNTQSLTTSAIPCTDNLKDRGTYKSTIAFQGYDESQAYYGKFDYSIFYHTNNGNTLKKMLKPIIIIDGFDPGDTRKTTDCDCENDPVCREKNSVKNFVFNTGFFPTVQSVFNPDLHESIEDNMYYNDVDPNGIPTRPNLIPKLRDQGYDVIILNIPNYSTSSEGNTTENKNIDGGADYIERNGRALASYLQCTKTTLTTNGSSEGIVIMGPSMGGLISRYALAYMEKKYAETGSADWKHNTRLWVSFDSPHLGANIPLGAQANIWFLGEKLRNSSAEEKFNKTINSIAAKQMLISQFSNTLNTMNNGTGYSNNSPFFTQFQSNLNSNGVAGSNGFPVSIPNVFRKIAIVNGSLTGTKSGVEAGEFLNVRGYKDPTFFEGLIGGSVIGSQIPFVGSVLGGIAGGIFGATNANITVLRVRDKFYPAYGQTDDIFNGDGQNFDIGWNHWYINHKWYNLKGTNSDIRGSLDVVPAGTFKTGKILRDEIVDGLDKAGLSSEVRGTYQEGHSFIPTFSSLAHLQPNQDWSNSLNYNLACPSNKQTPFDSYFGASSNTGHISLTKDMVDWLLKELGSNTTPPIPQAPYFPMQDNLLTGPNIVCENVNSTYSFNDICKVPSAVTWSVSPNLQIVSSTGYSLVVKGIANGSGTITATFQNGQKINKTLWVGKPMFGFNAYAIPESNNAYIVEMIPPDQYLNVSQYETTTWELLGTSGNAAFYNFFPNGNQLQLIANRPFQFDFKVKMSNSCGSWEEISAFGLELGEDPAGKTQFAKIGKDLVSKDDESFIVFPNPSNDIININLINKKGINIKRDENLVVEVFDIIGKRIKKIQIDNDFFNFSVADLNKGVYVLKIYLKDKIETHQVIIN